MKKNKAGNVKGGGGQKKKNKAPPRSAPVAPSGPLTHLAPYYHQRTQLGSEHIKLNAATPAVDEPLLGDPFGKSVKTQYLHKSDSASLILNGGHVTTQSAYSSKNPTNMQRILWIPPFTFEEPPVGSKAAEVFADPRGNFGDIANTRIVIKNIYNQDIRVVMSTPRGRITDPGTAYVRLPKREMVIKPGRVATYNCGWGDRANIFTPMCVQVKARESHQIWVQAFVLADFVVMVPDQNEFSGQDLTKETKVQFCEVNISQRYIATANFGLFKSAVVSEVGNTPFLLSKLATTADCFGEAPVTIVATTLNAKDRVIKILRVGMNTVVMGFRETLTEYNGRFVTLNGVPGRFKVVDGLPVLWDCTLNSPADTLEELSLSAPTFTMQVEANNLEKIDLGDIISFLTVVTRVLSIVAGFV